MKSRPFVRIESDPRLVYVDSRQLKKAVIRQRFKDRKTLYDSLAFQVGVFALSYVMVGLYRLWAVSSGENIKGIPFLDAPWKWLFGK